MRYTIDTFKDLMFINDIGFKFNGKTYFIFQGKKNSSIAGCYDDDTSITFDTYTNIDDNFDDLLNNWHIQGKRLRDIINEIEIL